jgi:dipeptidyl aminopeptidase/acylaminoacyl peptidase
VRFLVDELTVKEEVIDDAVAAIEALRAQPETDPRRVAVLGHSLGGYLLPLIAARSAHLAGGVIVAGPARPLEDLVLEQTTYIVGLDGSVDEAERAQLEALATQVARVKDAALSRDVPPSELPLGQPAAYWLSLRAHDPIALANELPLPLLVVQGGRDYQVTAADDFRLWREGLADRRARTRLVLLPSLNHLLAAGDGRSTPLEYQQAAPVAAELLDLVAQWVRELPPA